MSTKVEIIEVLEDIWTDIEKNLTYKNNKILGIFRRKSKIRKYHHLYDGKYEVCLKGPCIPIIYDYNFYKQWEEDIIDSWIQQKTKSGSWSIHHRASEHVIMYEPDYWQTIFTFENASDAILFKLTYT